ncbi:hypothetical protein BKA82DRAFT_598854 [Pisolithus tinctorius]|uniref:Uncharacterized protein n=1 Tax=Pisolithus tinctorius Marx 270 TaxID=870435 RepID=A0A0C3P8I4_PISTI|nr:hypothetical protein BKA82DRAFT_598854 [Pisolithus tinctorius]KIN94610.1 hypothetical protein M404DRAFT_374668 [Pisolithus tinctorius Marx 270]KIO04026.1 hypothetical protein M404DRAFT_598854 [Pisolithus tinctorius Marx 270]
MPSDHLSPLRTPCACAACLTGVACASRHKFIPFNTLDQHRGPNCIHTNPPSDTLYNIVGHWPDKYLSQTSDAKRGISAPFPQFRHLNPCSHSPLPYSPSWPFSVSYFFSLPASARRILYTVLPVSRVQFWMFRPILSFFFHLGLPTFFGGFFERLFTSCLVLHFSWLLVVGPISVSFFFFDL